MTRGLSRLTARALFAGILLVAHAAPAAPCGRPDVDKTYPPNGSENVPPNAFLAAHYRAPADYVDEIVTLTGPNGEVGIDVFYDNAESMLRALPRAELDAGRHELAWPALRGVATNRGLGVTVEFVVGETPDEEAPRFSGLDGIEWDLQREQDPCIDSQLDRFWFDLGIGSASDDLGTDLLAVVVFETRGPSNTRGSPEQIAVRPMPDKRRLRVVRPAKGGERICFAAVTRDLVNNVSGGGDQEVCVETTEPPFFDGCSLGQRSRTHPSSAALLAFLLMVAARRRGARHA
jgi:hypothetical protein